MYFMDPRWFSDFVAPERSYEGYDPYNSADAIAAAEYRVHDEAFDFVEADNAVTQWPWDAATR